MPEKEPFVPSADRPDLPAPPAPDRRIADLQVRDLDVLLQHALVRKSLKAEIDIHKHWKIEKIEKLEKWEHPKWEKFEKWEHPKWEIPEPPKFREPPIPDPGPLIDPRIDQLISAITNLQKEVEALKARIK
jgi:hypothetical protein